MTPPSNIENLVKRFQQHHKSYTAAQYNETQLRREFLDPLFESLGWDVNNRRGYAEAYKDVIHEDSIKIGDSARAPDYSFRVGGQRKFFVEAKKPSVNIEHEIQPAFQVRRYAWSAKLPLSILTDFEEFAVYQTRTKPHKKDNPAFGRILLLNYQDYLTQWDQISAIFSRDAVLKGSFDQYAEETTSKHGAAEVDTEFLRDIENWRELLARNFALRNPDFFKPGLNRSAHASQAMLNHAVQATIDRIIFLRICEDRGIEEYGRLRIAAESGMVYENLGQLFQQADQRYNSGLFHFNAEKERTDAQDTYTLTLNLDDKPLKSIIRSLYYPDSPYEFSVLPADILGQVYERFLGKVIRLTSGGQAKVEEKPEVKKAGGVFYTPTYIVDYIVNHTLEPLLAGKTPAQAASVRILDPACGSGSFLIEAYQHLLDWYRQQYSQYPEKYSKGKAPQLFQDAKGEWQLTTAARKRILLDHIYGVDIDSQAVEVTKLSLLLKVLEGESQQTVTQQMALFRERALPDLGRNIQCGNSLIGPDYYAGQQLSLLGEEESARLNIFDWQAAFPQVFRQGGFDAVIGNPPYVRQETLGELKTYLQTRYKVYHGMADLYAYFIERGVGLLKSGGWFGYIVANKWMRANYGKPLRRWLKTQGLVEINDFGDLPVFTRATTYPCILIIQKERPSSEFEVALIDTLDFPGGLANYQRSTAFTLDRSRLEDGGWSLVNPRSQALLDKLKQSGVPLGEYVEGKIYRGILTGLNKAFVIDAEKRAQLIAADPHSADLIKPFLAGRDIKRYQPLPEKQYLILMPRGWTNANAKGVKNKWDWLQTNYPSIAAHLEPFESDAKKRCDQGEYWWELRACDYYDEFEKPKIMLPDISLRGNFAYDPEGGKYCANTAYAVAINDLYLLGLLNSQVITFFYKNLSSTYRGGYLRFIYQYLEQLPIRVINFNDSADVAHHTHMVELVENMLSLHQQLAAAQAPHQHTALQRQIEATDDQIDALVYELYGLSDEEIEIVEEQ